MASTYDPASEVNSSKNLHPEGEKLWWFELLTHQNSIWTKPQSITLSLTSRHSATVCSNNPHTPILKNPPHVVTVLLSSPMHWTHFVFMSKAASHWQNWVHKMIQDPLLFQLNCSTRVGLKVYINIQSRPKNELPCDISLLESGICCTVCCGDLEGTFAVIEKAHNLRCCSTLLCWGATIMVCRELFLATAWSEERSRPGISACCIWLHPHTLHSNKSYSWICAQETEHESRWAFQNGCRKSEAWQLEGWTKTWTTDPPWVSLGRSPRIKSNDQE